MSKQHYDMVENEMFALGYAFFTKKSYNLNLIALRAASDRANLFDDTFLAVYLDDNFQPRVDRWACTTDPGRPHLENPMRKEGCAILVPGQYRGAFAQGLHNGHPALRQVKTLKVWRDNNKDGVLDRKGNIYDAPPECGINIHRAGEDSPLVELWSAGCQVFKRRADLHALLALCNRQERVFGEDGKRYSYTLIDVGDNPALAGLLL
jgi:hypothetical protein